MLRMRWLGQVPYHEMHEVQHALLDTSSTDDWLLMLEHPHVITLGRSARPEHVLIDPGSLGVDMVQTDRGGDVTYHGPGQLVGYPIISVPGRRPGSMTNVVGYVRSIEQLLAGALRDLGLEDIGTIDRHPGVWVNPYGEDPRKIAAIGVRMKRGRSMHGFALNVDSDLTWFDHIVPCGIADSTVTSLAAEGVKVTMAEVVDVIAAQAQRLWGVGGWERMDVAGRVHDVADHRDIDHLRSVVADPINLQGPSARLVERMHDAGVGDGINITQRKPPWLRANLANDGKFNHVRQIVRERKLATVCEEAGCPNISECWSTGTATFMINGDRCTRGCAFCLVDTRKPMSLDPGEPERIADAVMAMSLDFAVVTAVARDDLSDGGASGFVETIAAIRRRRPEISIEVLIPDCKGDPASLDAIFGARPEVLNHNLETVPRLQRLVRPSASYARSLSVLARAKACGLTTKSGLIVGMGETDDEVVATLADLNGIGVDIVTIGQYLRPTVSHLPVARWVEPERFSDWKMIGEAMGIGHVESSPLTRSSYHARQAADQV